MSWSLHTQLQDEGAGIGQESSIYMILLSELFSILTGMFIYTVVLLKPGTAW